MNFSFGLRLLNFFNGLIYRAPQFAQSAGKRNLPQIPLMFPDMFFLRPSAQSAGKKKSPADAADSAVYQPPC